MASKCYSCIYRRTIPGDCHTRCSNPDPDMTGNQHGIDNGWFAYPINFDPTWMTKECANYKSEEEERDDMSKFADEEMFGDDAATHDAAGMDDIGNK